jgi:hypothetical protein
MCPPQLVNVLLSFTNKPDKIGAARNNTRYSPGGNMEH